MFGERGHYPPQGIVQGEAAALNVFSYEQDDGWHKPPLVSKIRGIQLKKGHAVRLETPGGGGYGPTSERSPVAVAEDVASGLVSETKADETYGTAWREMYS